MVSMVSMWFTDAKLRNRLRGCAIEVQQISLDRYWDEAAVFEEETEKGSGKGPEGLELLQIPRFYHVLIIICSNRFWH